MRALQSDAEGALLYELLTIFSGGSLADYLAFRAKNEAFLAGLHLDNKRSSDTMRLLTLASLAAKDHVIPYDAVAAELKVRFVFRGRGGGDSSRARR